MNLLFQQRISSQTVLLSTSCSNSEGENIPSSKPISSSPQQFSSSLVITTDSDVLLEDWHEANTTIWTAISPVNCSIRIFGSPWHRKCNNISGKTRVFSFTYGKNLELIVVAKGSTLHSTFKHYCLRKTKYFENLPNRMTENTILRRNS